MKKKIMLSLIVACALIMSQGCVNSAILDSYDNHLNVTKVQTEEFAANHPEFKDAVISERLAAEKVVSQAKEMANKNFFSRIFYGLGF